MSTAEPDLTAGIRILLDAYEETKRHPYGPPIQPEQENRAKRACVFICQGDKGRGQALWESVKHSHGGYVSAGAALALVHAALGTNREPYVPVPEPS